MFCPKCGALLIPKLVKGKKVMACSCGYKEKELQAIEVKEIKVEKNRAVEVIESELDINPEVDIECQRCGHKKAGYWLQQTRAGDEAETRFYKCRKCNHTWREYD